MTITKQVFGPHVILFLCGSEDDITGYLNLLYNSAAIAEPRDTELPCTKIICNQERIIQKLAEWKAANEYSFSNKPYGYSEIEKQHGKHFKNLRAETFARLTNKYKEETIKWFDNLPHEPVPPKATILSYCYQIGYFDVDLDKVNSIGYRLINK